MADLGANLHTSPWLLAFRRADETDEPIIDTKQYNLDFSAIRCPICRWQPNRWSRWYCSDIGHPEYFFGGCGTEWNAFETGGLCPGCSHQWVWTACLSCYGWSKHNDWYE